MTNVTSASGFCGVPDLMPCVAVASVAQPSLGIMWMGPNFSNHQLKIFRMASILHDISNYCGLLNRSHWKTNSFINFIYFSINTNSKEYGFGQSILYENQLVFHTPPYSLQPVSLQECYEYIGKTNICVSKFDPEPKSPHNVENVGDRQSNTVRSTESGSPNIYDRKVRKTSLSYVLPIYVIANDRIQFQ